jgi:hypothetical protein
MSSVRGATHIDRHRGHHCDYEKVATFLDARRPKMFALKSNGGDVDEALKIGCLFRKFLILTLVPTQPWYCSGFTSRRPSLKFRCLSPPRKWDQYRMETKIAVFLSDGKYVFVSIDKDDLGTSPIEQCEGLVGKAMQEVVSNYFELKVAR